MAGMLAMSACGAGGSTTAGAAATTSPAVTATQPVGTPQSGATTPVTGASQVTGTARPGGTTAHVTAAQPGQPQAGTAAPTRAHPAADGDVDGDGRADTITIAQAGTLHVQYSGGGQDSVRFTAGSPVGEQVRVLGSADADRDGHAEVFVLADQGASMRTATMFRYVGGHLRLVTLAGSQVALAYGGSTGYVATWACRPAQMPGTALVTAAGPSSGANSYTVDVRYYRFTPGQASLALVSHRTAGPAPLDQLPTVRDGVSAAPGCGSARLDP
jgi:hypothetical protein